MSRRITGLTGLVTGLITVCAMSIGGGVPANAADTVDPLGTVAEATPETVASAADVLTRAHGVDAISASVAGTPVTIPVDPSDELTMGQGTGAISVSLPFAQSADDAAVEKPGVVSYDNNNGSITVPVVQQDGSLQINTVVEDESSPRQYRYELGISSDAKLVARQDGSVAIVDATNAPIAVIGAPWATDSSGAPVATHYEVVGTSVTQIIEPTSTTRFPVVADPKLTLQVAGRYGPGFYINLTGLEMKTVAMAVVALGGAAAVAVCSGSTKLPSPLARIAAIGCTLVGAPTINVLFRSIQSIANSPAYRSTTCYQTLLNVSRPFVATVRTNCS